MKKFEKKKYQNVNVHKIYLQSFYLYKTKLSKLIKMTKYIQ